MTTASTRSIIHLSSLILAMGCGSDPAGQGQSPATDTPGAGGAATTPVNPVNPIPGAVGSGGASPGGVSSGGVSSAGVSSGGASSAGAGNVAAGGAPTVPPGDTWTPASNLDANGKLIAPASGEGYQISTPVFDLKPGDEVFKCFHVTMPNPTEFDVGLWESQMSAGSHHFILYRADGDPAPNGTLDNNGCNTSGPTGPAWTYASGSPRTHMPLPDGVAMPIAASAKMVFDMHYINLTQAVIHANVTLNMTKVKAAQFEKAQALVSFNEHISIPPNGTQTVGGDCTPPPGAKFFIMSTHTHRRGINAKVTRGAGPGGAVIVDTDNWDNPLPALWGSAPFLTFAPGEKYHYECSYQNDRAQTTTVGSSAAVNEMCMAIGYFFPATSGGYCTN